MEKKYKIYWVAYCTSYSTNLDSVEFASKENADAFIALLKASVLLKENGRVLNVERNTNAMKTPLRTSSAKD